MGAVDLAQKVSVIIPFYQRKKGLLKRAVSSVFSSKGNFVVEVVVVDDGSPVSARGELKGFLGKVRLVEQSNRGPAAARNAGLELASGDFIAFLDSDDCFTPEHLQRALKALQYCDFYFSNYIDPEKHDWFERTKFLSKIGSCKVHSQGMEGFFELKGPFKTILRTGPGVIGTSTVVVKRRLIGKTRFDERLFNCEDSLFWVDLLAKGAKCFYSTKPEAVYGTGINIGFNAVLKPNSRQKAFALQMWKTVMQRYGKRDKETRELIVRCIRRFYSNDLFPVIIETKSLPLLLKALSMPQYFFPVLFFIARHKASTCLDGLQS